MSKFVDLELGSEAESEFAKLLLNPVGATRSQDMYQHWDVSGVYSDLSGSVLKFDVKNNVDRERYAFPVELKNVHGQAGWLYGGAHCIAFNHPDTFTVVSRFLLVELVESLMGEHGVSEENYVTDKHLWNVLGTGDPASKVYRRVGPTYNRDDRVVLVGAEDMWSISSTRPCKRSKQRTLSIDP